MKKLYQCLWLLFLGLFSLGQLQRLQLTSRIAVYGHDLLLTLWLGLSIFSHSQAWRQWLKKLSQKKIYLIFTGWVILGLAVNFGLNGWQWSPLLYIARLLLYLGSILSLNFIQPFSSRTQRRLWLAVGLLVAGWGLGQYLLLPDTRFLRFLGWDDHYFRLIGPLFDPNFTGLFLVMSLFLWTDANLNHWLKRGALLIMAAAIALTYSRASYLSLVTASLTLAWFQLKAKKISTASWLYLSVFLLLIFLPFLPRPGGEGVNLTRTYSVTTRVENTQGALAQLKPYQWFLGRGWFVPFESSPAPLTDTAHFPDNLVVYILASTGVIGLVLMVIILWQWGQFLYKQDIFIFSAFVAVIIHSQVNHSLWQPFIFLALLGFTQLAREAKS